MSTILDSMMNTIIVITVPIIMTNFMILVTKILSSVRYCGKRAQSNGFWRRKWNSIPGCVCFSLCADILEYFRNPYLPPLAPGYRYIIGQILVAFGVSLSANILEKGIDPSLLSVRVVFYFSPPFVYACFL